MIENDTILVSVIVPVYNVEKYLRRCVDSILAQSYTNYEIILVDDGSQDNCPQICDEYERKYAKVKVIHKLNGGLSDARNYGISSALGQFVTFVDSDDYISCDYLYELVNNLIRYQANMATVNCWIDFEEVSGKQKKNARSFDECIDGKSALERVLYQKGLDTHAWGLLVPREIAMRFLFPVGKYHEDDFTTINYYLSCNKVAVSNKELYCYYQRKTSIMHTKFGKASLDELEASDCLVTVCSAIDSSLERAAKSKKFSNYCQVLLKNEEIIDVDKETYLRIEKYLMSEWKNILFDHKARLKNRIAALSLAFGIKGLFFINSISLVKSIK